jgi:hypothetical protein
MCLLTHPLYTRVCTEQIVKLTCNLVQYKCGFEIQHMSKLCLAGTQTLNTKISISIVLTVMSTILYFCTSCIQICIYDI